MDKPISTISDVLNALPEVQKAVKAEISARVAAGEQIASYEEIHLSFGKPVQPYNGRGFAAAKVSKRKSAA